MRKLIFYFLFFFGLFSCSNNSNDQDFELFKKKKVDFTSGRFGEVYDKMMYVNSPFLPTEKEHYEIYWLKFDKINDSIFTKTLNNNNRIIKSNLILRNDTLYNSYSKIYFSNDTLINHIGTPEDRTPLIKKMILFDKN